jgi:predicted nucleic acid-binding protein
MGLTVLDAGVLIGYLDKNDGHHRAAYGALGEALARNDEVALPASAYAEALVGPSRSGSAALTAVRRLIERLPIVIAALDEEIAAAAADIRARHRSLKLPDALVIATAIVLDADLLVTTDRKWPSRNDLGVRAAIKKL